VHIGAKNLPAISAGTFRDGAASTSTHVGSGGATKVVGEEGPAMDRDRGLRRDIGLAVVGCGAIGRIRATLARDHTSVGWLGLCDRNEAAGVRLAGETGADLFTVDMAELINRPEVDAVIVATDESEHEGPATAAARAGKELFIEKPLATSAQASQRLLAEIEAADVDAVVGYTQRFRRRFLAAKARLQNGAIGEVTTVVSRSLLSRTVPLATLRRSGPRTALTPVVVAGTHAVDLCLWLLAGKTPAAVYARSVDRSLGSYGARDATAAVITMTDGTLWSLTVNWALPAVWPGSGYGLELSLIGTRGAIDIDDSHRDVILASEVPQPCTGWGESVDPGEADSAAPRHVDYLASYPPGDWVDGQLWGPMREETTAWLARLVDGARTPHATVADGHRTLLLTMAMDLAATRCAEVELPVDPAELDEQLA
jgi:predicted dehydrogenase